METKKQEVTIINKNYPPSFGITGESANQLALFLQSRADILVKVVHANAKYAGGVGNHLPNGTLFSVKSLYDGKNNLVRLVASFFESLFLILKAIKISNGPIIVMTDPPFLNFWAAILLKNKKWIYWSMDLFPEAFISAGLISRKNFFLIRIEKAIKKYPPSGLIALGTYQKQFIEKYLNIDLISAIINCGVWDKSQEIKSDKLPEWYHNKGKIYIGYCGNLGQAHSFEFIQVTIDNLDVEKFIFVLSVYGKHAEKILAYASNKEGVIIVKNVQRNHLSIIDIHLVSLQSNWEHICVPSKAITAICAGSTVLYCGNEKTDTWNSISEAAWRVNNDELMKENIQHFISTVSLNDINQKKQNALIIAQNMNKKNDEGFTDVVDMIISSNHN